MAKKSILVASVFGLLSFFYVGLTGDESAHSNAYTQPMKLAAYEGLYDGEQNAGIVALGVLNPAKKTGDDKDAFLFEVKIPYLLAYLSNRKLDSFVPGINDLVYGNKEQNILGISEKIPMGKKALADLKAYKDAKDNGDGAAAETALASFKNNQQYLGYGYLDKPEEAVPPVQTSFYAFHIMVFLALFFAFIFVVYLVFGMKDTIASKRWLLPLGIASFFLSMLASQAGWVVAEVGRQPWAIQDMLPVGVATSNIASGNVVVTFFMFAGLFTLLLIAEIKIMLTQIKKGPEGE